MMSLFDLDLAAVATFAGAFGVFLIQSIEMSDMATRGSATVAKTFSRDVAFVTAARRGFLQGKQ